jgi:L-iditol 2-dehydrogenase
VGTFAINRTFQEAIEMIRGGVVNVKPLVSHTVPLTDFEAGPRPGRERSRPDEGPVRRRGIVTRTPDAPRRVEIGSPHDLRLERAEPTEPRPGEARLRPLAIGVCGSDLHVLAGHHPFVSYPVFPGHEIAAEVTAVGDDADAGWIGRRVALEPSLACGTCRPCRSGRYNICENLRVMGFQAPGGMADAFVAPLDRLHRLPDALSDTAGALVEPVAVATHAARLAREGVGTLDGRDVAVIGAGTIGILCAQVARAAGAEVTVADLDDARRDLARDLGFRAREVLDGGSSDLAFECVGAEGALRGAIDASRKGATVLVVGVYGSHPKIQAALIQDWELRLQGSLMYTAEDYEEAIRLLSEGSIDAERMITSEHPLDDVERAFEIAAAGGASLKVVLKP